VDLGALLKAAEDDDRVVWEATANYKINEKPLPTGGAPRKALKGAATIKDMTARLCTLCETNSAVLDARMAAYSGTQRKRVLLARMVHLVTDAIAAPGHDTAYGVTWGSPWKASGKRASAPASQTDAGPATPDTGGKRARAGPDLTEASTEELLAALAARGTPSTTATTTASAAPDPGTAVPTAAGATSTHDAVAATPSMAELHNMARALGVTITAPPGAPGATGNPLVVDDDVASDSATLTTLTAQSAMLRAQADVQKQIANLRSAQTCSTFAEAAASLQPTAASALQLRNQQHMRDQGNVQNDCVHVSVFALGEQTPPSPAWTKKIWEGTFHPDVTALIRNDKPSGASDFLSHALGFETQEKDYNVPTRDAWQTGMHRFRVAFTQKWPTHDNRVRGYMRQVDRYAQLYGMEAAYRYDMAYRRSASDHFMATALPPSWQVDDTLCKVIFGGLRPTLCQACGSKDFFTRDCTCSGKSGSKSGTKRSAAKAKGGSSGGSGASSEDRTSRAKPTKSNEICRLWQQGKCKKTAAECKHHHGPVPTGAPAADSK